MRNLYKALALATALPLAACSPSPQNRLDATEYEGRGGPQKVAFTLQCSSGDIGGGYPTFTCYFNDSVGAEFCGTQVFEDNSTVKSLPVIQRRDRTLAFLLTRKEQGTPVRLTLGDTAPNGCYTLADITDVAVPEAFAKPERE